MEGAIAKSVSAITALASLGRETWFERRRVGDSCLEKLLKDEASVIARLPRLSGRTWVSELGELAPTLCLKREYRPLIRPLTKSLGPGTRGPVLRLGSKSLKEVRVTEREAVVWIWSSSFCKASLSTMGELTDDSEARLEAGDECMRAVVGIAVDSAGGKKL
jgi:hypothetical protein